MRKDWILDVLADLREFASQNQLDALAEQLMTAELVACRELAPGGEVAPVLGRREALNVARVHRTTGLRPDA